MPGTVFGGPSGGQVNGGSAIVTQDGQRTAIHQQSDRAILDWQSFNVQSDESVTFYQPSSGSVALNRIHDPRPSRIDGHLEGNGHVILLNQNGVVFGGGSRVDVGSLTVSTADIENARFMAGDLSFSQPGRADGRIANHGIISAREGGLVTLVAPRVENHGIISARLGKVQMAAADTFTLDMAGDGLIQVAVSNEDAQKLAYNAGLVSAAGGIVSVDAVQARELVDSLAYNTGVIEAVSLDEQGGRVILGKGHTGIVVNDGVLDASGRGSGAQGGNIEVLGQHITLGADSLLDASGTARGATNKEEQRTRATPTLDRDLFMADSNRGGGSILVGGDYLGGGDTPRARGVYVAGGALIVNDALENGDGGRTIVWSDDKTVFKGLVLSRGGHAGGDGGFLETSGKNALSAQGFADLSNRAEGYNKGTYLLDPQTITIYGNVDPAFVSTDSSIDLATPLQLWLDGNDIDGDGVAEGVGESGLVSGIGSCGTAITCVDSWKDKSGKDNHASQAVAAQRPEFTLAGENGLDVVTYSKTPQYVAVPHNANVSIEGDGMTTVVTANASSNGMLINKENSYEIAIMSNKLRAAIETQAGGSWNWGGTLPVSTGNPDIYAFQHDNTAWNFYVGGQTQSTAPASGQTGDIKPSAKDLWIGRRQCCGGQQFSGNMMEVILYDSAISEDSMALLNQYQSAKWGIGLDKLSGAGTEVSESLAHDSGDPLNAATNGYNVFTSDYLERLAASADLVLQASDSITLDLRDDVLDLSGGSAAGKSITLQTDNGDITDVSGGTIRTVRTGAGAGQQGNITVIAGGAGAIDLDATNLEAGSGGLVNLRAGGDITLVQGSSLNLGVAVSGGDVSITANGVSSDISGSGGIITSGGTIGVNSGRDIDFTSVGLRSVGGNMTLGGGRDVTLNTSVNAGSGDVTVTAGRDIAVVVPDVSDGLVAHWAFDEGAGGTASDSAGANDGTLLNGPAWSVSDPFGLPANYSLSFDGSDDLVDIGNLGLGTQEKSLSLWLNPDLLTNDMRVISNTNNANFSIRFSGSGIQVWGNTWKTIIPTAGPAGVWSHYVFNFDGSGNVTGYRDGTVASTSLVNENWSSLGIGDELNNSYGSHFDGLIDDVRIYNKALNEGHLTQLMAPNWSSGRTVMDAVGDVRLGGVVSGSGSGNALVLSSGGSFVNTAGSGALNASDAGGRWLVYSSDPAGDTLGGLSGDFKRYNKSYGGYGPGSVVESGNGLLYSIAPTLIYRVGDDSVEYGDAYDGVTSVNYSSGLIDGDTLVSAGITGSANILTGYMAGDAAGSYANALGGATGSLASMLGYDFAFVSGDLEVSKAPLVVSADDKSAVYGDALPSLSGVVTGFKLGEDSSVLDMLPSYGTAAVAGSDAGSYAITGSGASDTNYSVSYVNGTLTITKAPLLVTADDLSFTQGSPLPVIYLYSGFKNGDDEDTAGITGLPALLGVSDIGTLAAGTYDMDLDLTGLSAINYSFSEGVPKGILQIAAPPARNGLPDTVLKVIAAPPSQLSGTGGSTPGGQTGASTTQDDKKQKASSRIAVANQNTQNNTISADFIAIEKPIINFFQLCSYNQSFCE